MYEISLNQVFSVAGVLSLGLLALMFALVWRAQREAWAGFFALGYALSALPFGIRVFMPVADGRPNALLVAFALLSIMMLTYAFVRYVDVPRALARRIEFAGLVIAALFLPLVVTGVLGYLVTLAVLSSFLLCQAWMAWHAMRREPRHGHGVVFAALMLLPAMVLLVAVGVFPEPWLRFAVIAALTVSGATVLTIGLLRAQHRAAAELRRREHAEVALTALNETLELRVAQRTAELHEMVGGLESFNRSVSHDLRGPLGGIAGVSRLASEALARHDMPAVQRMLAAIPVQAEALGQLVNDLLALARVRDAEFEPQTVDLQAFVTETLEQMRLNQGDGQALPVEVGPLPSVEADPGLLRQVVVNLLGNAIKFSRDAQPPRIELGALVSEDAGKDGDEREQVLFVRDNGVGFDAAQAERLFQPFRRLHGSRYTGHGVGLSIVKRIIERHGGRLWVQAQPNAGATFFFSLPTARHRAP